MTPKEAFEQSITFIHRDGIDQLVKWLKEETDFFTAPSSASYHGNYAGGLLAHSVNVLEFAIHNFNLLAKKKPEYEHQRESLIISALFHDVCKTNQYKITEKWTKDANNKWQSYQGYEVDDQFPIGHGEKSVILISQFMKLTQIEALAIRWHMGSFEVSTIIPGMTKFSYDKAYEQPLVVILHAADMMATKAEDKIDYKLNAAK
jgi:hypothetical protein